ncbi:MAG: tetratricopeptide repeat protein [Anaerolineae bacterium]
MYEIIDRAKELLEKERPDEALDLLDQEQERFGRNPDYLLTMAIALSQCGELQEAAECARAATERAPRRVEFHMVAATLYELAGYHTFAIRACRTAIRLGDDLSQTDPEVQQIEGAYRDGIQAMMALAGVEDPHVVEQAAYLHDQARWALAQGQWAEAEQHCRKALALMPAWTPLHNNRSLALYYMGRVAEAAEEAEMVLRTYDAKNVQALSNGIRCYIVLGHMARADELGDRLEAISQPEDRDDVEKRIEGLAFLERDEAVDRAVRDYAHRFGDLTPDLHLKAGIAAANLGRHRDARRHLRAAQDAGWRSDLTDDTLDAMDEQRPGRGDAGRFSYTQGLDWVPREALEIASRYMEADLKRGSRDTQRWAKLSERYPQLPYGLRKLLYEGIPGVEMASADPLLELLVSLGSPEAYAVLREFGSGRLGDQRDRMQAMGLLAEEGVLAPGERLSVWIGDQPRTVTMLTQGIVPDVSPKYSQAALRAFGEAIEAFEEDRMDDAERGFQRTLKLEPRAKEALANLAIIANRRGDRDLAHGYLDKALAIDPLSVTPRAMRALHAIEEGDIQAAKEWLKPLATVTEWQRSQFATYQKTLAEIALAEDNLDAAKQMLELALMVTPDDSGVEELLYRVDAIEALKVLPQRFQRMKARSAVRRLRVQLSPDPTLDECLGLLPKYDLEYTARLLDMGSVSHMRKAQLKTAVAAEIMKEGALERDLATLNDAQRDALREVLEHGGVMTWEDYARRHQSDTVDAALVDLSESARLAVGVENLTYQLRLRGLFCEGTADGRQVVAVPRELRPRLASLLQEPQRTAE